jgi:outer membrane protein
MAYLCLRGAGHYRLVLLMVLFPVFSLQSEPLTVKEAARMALQNNSQIAATVAAVSQSEAKRHLSHQAYVPTLGYSESDSYTNHAVDIFVYKLLQRRFEASDLTLQGINRPAPYSNFQSQVHASQLLYDGGRSKAEMRLSEAGKSVANQEVKIASDQILGAVARAYYGAVLSRENIRLAREAIRSAEANLKRAQDIFDVGRSTELDVLSLKVQLAGMREQEIRRVAEFDVWNSTLNQLMGKPLDQEHEFTTPLRPAPVNEAAFVAYEKQAVDSRPEAKRSLLQIEMAEDERDSVNAAYRPQANFMAWYEADRRYWATEGSTNFGLMIQVEWTFFDGMRRRDRLNQAEYGIQQAKAGNRELVSSLRLEVRRAEAELRGAQQRLEVTATAIEQAREALRISESRYAAGLTSVTELIQQQTALLDVQTRHLASTYEQRTAVIALELAAGSLDESKIQ